MQKEYQFPCEQCGAKLKFSAIEGELRCSYCSHINIIQRNFKNIVEKDYNKTLKMLKNFTKKPIEVTSVKCKSCAATFDINDDIHASTCPYCDSPIVNEINQYKPIQPQAILPFKITKEEARKVFKSWLKNRWFAPNKLKQYAGEDSKLKAIYIPYWTYDSDTFSRYTGRRGDIYYVEERYTAIINGRSQIRTRKVQKINWSYT
ncbi:MAG: primosomal protein N' (replication factor Y) - superfamily II helicase, partial [Epsilonproteobacteria bacterium]|nr:primosomal protein N' (replication factor Y) - superfamily II helicase [Campylobacterota bacterium]